MSRSRDRAKKSERQTSSGDLSLSTKVLNHQLGNANDRVKVLEAEVAALQAELGRLPDTQLVKIAEELRFGSLAISAVQGQKFDESGVRQRNKEYPMPGQATHNARIALSRFRRDMGRALAMWVKSREHNWRIAPTIQCWSRECGRYGRTEEAWVEWRGRTLNNEFCPSCGSRYGRVEEEVA